MKLLMNMLQKSYQINSIYASNGGAASVDIGVNVWSVYDGEIKKIRDWWRS